MEGLLSTGPTPSSSPMCFCEEETTAVKTIEVLLNIVYLLYLNPLKIICTQLTLSPNLVWELPNICFWEEGGGGAQCLLICSFLTFCISHTH